MFGGKAFGWMAGTLIWMPGAPGKRTLIAQEHPTANGWLVQNWSFCAKCAHPTARLAGLPAARACAKGLRLVVKQEL